MSTLRAPGQKLISVPMNEKFIEQIDAALHKVGYSDRSSFIRDAIVEKLHGGGIPIPVELSLAPSRTGKGGRPPLSTRRPAKEVATRGASAANAKTTKNAKPAKGKTKFRVPGGANPAGAFGRNRSAV